MGLVSCEFECDYCKKRAAGIETKPMITMVGGKAVSAGAVAVKPPKGWLLLLLNKKTLTVCSDACATMRSMKDGEVANIERRVP